MRITRKGYYTIQKPDGSPLLKPDGELRQATTRDDCYEYISEDGDKGVYVITSPDREVELMPTINIPGVSVLPAVASAQNYLFFDDFSSGDLSHSENGLSYTEWGGDAGKGEVNTVKPFSGAYSGEMIFGPDANGADSSVELTIKTSTANYDDIWCQYHFYVPDNYTHRGQSGSTNNKGFFYSWSGDYGNPDGVSMGTNLWEIGGGDGSSEASNYIWGPTLDYHIWDAMSDAIDIADRGTWVVMTIHHKLATSANNDGVAEIWRKRSGSAAEKIEDITNGAWYQSSEVGFDSFRILGWANSGFASETKFYIDNLIIHNEALDPEGEL